MDGLEFRAMRRVLLAIAMLLMGMALVGGAAAALVIAVGGWAMFGGGTSKSPEDLSAIAPAATAATGGSAIGAQVETLAPTTKSLANDARTAGAPGAAIDRLAAAGDDLGKQYDALRTIVADPAKAAQARAAADSMKQLAIASDVEFAKALVSDGEIKLRGLSLTGDQSAVRSALDGVRAAATAAAAATDPAQALAAARDALAKSQGFTVALASAYRQQAAADRAEIEAAKAAKAATLVKNPRAVATPVATVVAPIDAAPAASGTSGKIRQLESIIADGRSMASQVIRKGTPANVQLARGYDRYLANLKDSSRGIKTDREADAMIAQAKRTRAYLQYLVKQASGGF